MILNDVIDMHYLPNKKEKVRPNTLNGYISSINLHIRPYFGEKEIESITYIEVQDWVDSISTPGGAIKAYKTLRQIIRWYINRFRVKIEDPAIGIELPIQSNTCQQVFTKEEERKFLKGIKNHPCEAVALAQLDLGLRKSEAFGLRWTDINFKTGMVHISRSRQFINGEDIILQPKTELSNRVLKFSKKTKRRLKKIYKRTQSKIYLCDINPNVAANMLKEYALLHNLPWIPMKNFRHTWATRAIEEGAALAAVGKWMGHTSITMAYGRYIQFSHKMVDQLAKELHRR